MSDPPRTIRTAERVFDIVDVLHNEGECNLSEIANEVDLAESTTHQYLDTLVSLDIIIKNDLEYSIGLKFLEYGGLARQRLHFYRAAKPELVKLKEQTGLKAHLAVEEELDLVRLENIRPESDFWFGGYVGHRGEFHSSALGKSILAHVSREKRGSILSKHDLCPYTDNTITNRSVLEDELKTVRARGYAVNDEEEQINLKAVARPVLVEETIEGAIAVAGPKTELELDEEAIVQNLHSVTDRIELRMRE